MAKSRMMMVETGDLKWKGRASSVGEAVARAFVHPPQTPGILVRIHDGFVFHYLEFWAAMKMAGYKKADFLRP